MIRVTSHRNFNFNFVPSHHRQRTLSVSLSAVKYANRMPVARQERWSSTCSSEVTCFPGSTIKIARLILSSCFHATKWNIGMRYSLRMLCRKYRKKIVTSRWSHIIKKNEFMFSKTPIASCWLTNIAEENILSFWIYLFGENNKTVPANKSKKGETWRSPPPKKKDVKYCAVCKNIEIRSPCYFDLHSVVFSVNIDICIDHVPDGLIILEGLRN